MLSPPVGAKRWRRIGNSLKRVHSIRNAATDLTISGFDSCIHVYTSFKALGSLGETLS